MNLSDNKVVTIYQIDGGSTYIRLTIRLNTSLNFQLLLRLLVDILPNRFIGYTVALFQVVYLLLYPFQILLGLWIAHKLWAHFLSVTEKGQVIFKDL